MAIQCTLSDCICASFVPALMNCTTGHVSRRRYQNANANDIVGLEPVQQHPTRLESLKWNEQAQRAFLRARGL